LHFFVDGVHVVDVSHLLASAVFGEMPRLSAVKTRAFGASGSIVLLYWYFCHVTVFWLDEIGVRVVTLVLTSVVGGSDAG
jgi:hypothetical protein